MNRSQKYFYNFYTSNYFITNFTSFNFINLFRKTKEEHGPSYVGLDRPIRTGGPLSLSFSLSARPKLAQHTTAAQSRIGPGRLLPPLSLSLSLTPTVDRRWRHADQPGLNDGDVPGKPKSIVALLSPTRIAWHPFPHLPWPVTSITTIAANRRSPASSLMHTVAPPVKLKSSTGPSYSPELPHGVDMPARARQHLHLQPWRPGKQSPTGTPALRAQLLGRDYPKGINALNSSPRLRNGVWLPRRGVGVGPSTAKTMTEEHTGVTARSGASSPSL